MPLISCFPVLSRVVAPAGVSLFCLGLTACSSSPSEGAAPVAPVVAPQEVKPAAKPVATGPVESWSNPLRANAGGVYENAHGIFNAEPVSVSERGLPEHGWVKVKFNLIIKGGWDGSNTAWGPDIWAMRVRGGEQLVMTTFSNIGANTPYYVQAYPDDFPIALHYAFTGAVPVNGKPFAEPDPESGMAMADASYPVEVYFPHKATDLTLDFMPVYNDPAYDNQHWAIADFEVTTSIDPVELSADQLDDLWEALAAPNSVEANLAMWKLISAGNNASGFLVEKAKTLGRPDPDLINKPEGLRINRLQKALRIMGSRRSEGITYKIPQYGSGAPPVSE